MQKQVRKRASAVCVNRQQLLAVRLRDPKSFREFWSVPGGGLEAGESAAEAARRETLEETGYRVAIGPQEIRTDYPFVWGGRRYDCTTWWFAATLLGRAARDFPAPEDEEIVAVAWLPLAELDIHFTHREILLPLRKLLQQARFRDHSGC